MKKIIMFTAIILMITLTLPATASLFDSTDKLVNWIGNIEPSPPGWSDWYKFSQLESVITVESITDEFTLRSIFTMPNGNMRYLFEGENRSIDISVHIGALEGGKTLSEAVASLSWDFQNEVIYLEGFGTTNIYYDEHTANFEIIDGTFIVVIIPEQNPDGTPNTKWDSSYLDLFRFTLRPINRGGEQSSNIGDMSEEIIVTFNGIPIEFDIAPITENDRTLVPMRAIFETLGMDVEWDNDTRTAIGIKDNFRIEIPIDSYIAYVDGEAVELDVPAMLYNERTMVPVRFIAEVSGADVIWSGVTQTVIISTD